jgi:ketosteroid isomerase-like protein
VRSLRGFTLQFDLMRALILSAALLWVRPAATVPVTGHDAEAITRVEMELNDALMACDGAALRRLWAEDMTFVFPNGVMETRAQRLGGLSDCTPGAQRSTVESISVTHLGDSVVALVLSAWSASIDGKPFAAKFRATHVWARRKGGWVLVAAHVSQLKP